MSDSYFVYTFTLYRDAKHCETGFQLKKHVESMCGIFCMVCKDPVQANDFVSCDSRSGNIHMKLITYAFLL